MNLLYGVAIDYVKKNYRKKRRFREDCRQKLIDTNFYNKRPDELLKFLKMISFR